MGGMDESALLNVITKKLVAILGENEVDILSEYVWHMINDRSLSETFLIRELTEFLTTQTGEFVAWLRAEVLPNLPQEGKNSLKSEEEKNTENKSINIEINGENTESKNTAKIDPQTHQKTRDVESPPARSRAPEERRGRLLGIAFKQANTNDTRKRKGRREDVSSSGRRRADRRGAISEKGNFERGSSDRGDNNERRVERRGEKISREGETVGRIREVRGLSYEKEELRQKKDEEKSENRKKSDIRKETTRKDTTNNDEQNTTQSDPPSDVDADDERATKRSRVILRPNPQVRPVSLVSASKTGKAVSLAPRVSYPILSPPPHIPPTNSPPPPSPPPHSPPPHSPPPNVDAPPWLCDAPWSAPPTFDPLPPVKIKKRCTHWPNCSFGGNCRFIHPKEKCGNWPHCLWGRGCFYIHPEVPCRFGARCLNESCNYTHPEDASQQTYFGKQSAATGLYRNKTLQLASTDVKEQEEDMQGGDGLEISMPGTPPHLMSASPIPEAQIPPTFI